MTSEILDLVNNSKSVNYLGQVHGVKGLGNYYHMMFLSCQQKVKAFTALLEAISSYCEIIQLLCATFLMII